MSRLRRLPEEIPGKGRRAFRLLTPLPAPDRRFEVRRRRDIRLFLTIFLAIELGFALLGAATEGPGALADDRSTAMVAGVGFAISSAILVVVVRRLRSVAALELAALFGGVVALSQSLFGQLHHPSSAAAVSSYEAIAIAVIAFAIPLRPLVHYSFVALATAFALAGLAVAPSGADPTALAGAVGFACLIALIGKPIAWNGRVQLELQATRARRLRHALAGSRLRDDATGLGTRRGLDEALAAIARRRSGRIGLVAIGIDPLTSLADRFGRVAGDEAILQAGRAVRRAVRSVDSAFLVRPDEFVVIMDRISEAGPEAAAARIRQEVEGLGLLDPASGSGLLTVTTASLECDLPATVSELDDAVTDVRAQIDARRDRDGTRPAARGRAVALATGRDPRSGDDPHLATGTTLTSA